jgi:hypothetical protein
MNKLGMDRPDYTEREACADPGIDRQSRAGLPSCLTEGVYFNRVE